MSVKTHKKLFLLDAFALIYRAHFVFTKSPRINSKGSNTSIPFGFTNTLLDIIQNQKPSHIGVAFDTPEETFRTKIFKDYKANRDEAPEDVQQSLPIVRKIVEGFNIPILEKAGYEADDVIGTMATKAVKEDFQVYMMTPDKDFGQLVNTNVFLYRPAYRGNAVSVMGVPEVCEKWNIADVSQVTDMLGLQGDTSDNIPGIPGIGPKTASALLKQYDTIENIIANADKLKGKQKENVLRHKEQAILSKQLATIALDVPINFNEQELKYTSPDKEALQPLFEELEFKALAKRVFKTPPKSTPPSSSKTATGSDAITLFDTPETKTTDDQLTSTSAYHTVQLAEDRAQLIQQLLEQSEFAFEIIIEGNAHADFVPVGLVFSFLQAGYYVPLPTPDEARNIIKEFQPVFSRKRIIKAGHNIKRAILVLKRYEITLQGQLFDTLLAHYLLEPELSHKLDTIALQYLDYRLEESENSQENSCHRVRIIASLVHPLRKELEEKGHAKLMSDIEVPLISTLADMEAEGIKINTKSLEKMSKELQRASREVQQEIYALAGAPFNIASPKQVGEVLFDKLKLVEKPKKTKTGQYATGEEVLTKLAKKHTIVFKMLNFRAYEKLRSTYVDTLPKMVCQRDHRIHTDYRQAVAATGRLSSINPNLQNIPIRTEQGRKVRAAFIPRDEKYALMSADYSQIELRIAASFAQDQTMIEAFRVGRDIHATTAAKIFDTPLQEVSKEMRRKAKEVNFGILYGSAAFGLAQNLNITHFEASNIITSYFKEFSAIRRYMDEAISKAKEKGYVETILGRRRYLHAINSRNAATRGFAERNAINAPIQGSAADIIKIAMLHIHQWLQREKLKTKMLLQVHDELVFDLYREEEEIVKPKVIELMRTAVVLDVPMEVEVGIGENWLEAH